MEQMKSIIYSRMRIALRVALGRLFNVAGIPGLVQPCSYQASVTDGDVIVKKSELFTIISVNGIDIYFHRLTGAIDGVGVSDCKLAKTRESELAHGLPES